MAKTYTLDDLRALAPTLAKAGRNAFPGMCGVMSGTGIEGHQPFGLYDEAATLDKVQAVFRRMLDAVEGVELYEPSNGFEGEWFMSKWCARCTKDNLDPDTGEGGCDIIAESMTVDVDDPDYPRAWRQDGPEGPRCTEFVERPRVG